MNHSSALEYSSQLPVSVYGTGCHYLKFQHLFSEVDPQHYHLDPKVLVYYPYLTVGSTCISVSTQSVLSFVSVSQ